MTTLAVAFALALPGAVSGAARLGAATTDLRHPTLPRAEGHGAALSLEGRLAGAGVTLPLALISVAQPAGAYVDAVTVGNPSLFVERGAGRLSVALPLAARGASDVLLANRALLVAGALAGWTHPELVAPGRLAVTASAAGALSSGRWTAGGEARLALLARVAGASRLAGWPASPLLVAPSGAAVGGLRVTSRLAVSLGGELASPPGRVFGQVAARPAIVYGGPGGTLRADLFIPLGGGAMALGLEGALRW